MKKIYLLASCAILGSASFAQNVVTGGDQSVTPTRDHVLKLESTDRAPGDIIWEDDFADTSNWAIDNGVQGEWLNIITHTEDINGGGDGTPDFFQYVTTPAMTTAANGMLSFNGIRYLLLGTVQNQEATVSMDSSISCLGVTSVSVSFEQAYRAFNSDEQFVEVSVDGGNTWPGSFLINDQYAVNSAGVSETVRVNISSVAANQPDVRVRFRWASLSANSGYGWAIDDFKIFETESNDNEIQAGYFVSGVQNLDYHFVPTTQVSAISFSGERCNIGGEDQTNAKFNFDVTGNETFNTTSAPGTFTALACDSVVGLATFTPNGTEGVYNVSYWVDSDEAENVTSNDTMYSEFEVTDVVYSRDNGLIGGGISNVTSQPGQPLKIGNIMDIVADMDVRQIDLGIGSNGGLSVGQTVSVEIQRYNAVSDAYEYLENSAEYTVQAGDEGSIVTLELNSTVNLSAGDDILLMAVHNGGVDLDGDGFEDEVSFITAQTTYEGTVIGYTADGNTFQLLSPGAVVIRLIEALTGIEENGTALSSTSVYPNPANEVANINFTLTESAKVSVEIVDYTGKTISNENLGTLSAGESTHAVNTSVLAEGVYFYNLSVNGDVITKKLVVSKK